MNIRIKDDGVQIDGYVNAVERLSKPLRSRIGAFLERIKKGAFGRALKRRDNVRLLLNHDEARLLACTRDGTLRLKEDAIGLHADAFVTDPEVVQKARNGDLVGWSFGFSDVDVDLSEQDGMPVRDVKDLELYEVSILDRTKTPAYDGTSVSVRSDDQTVHYADVTADEPQIRQEEPEPDYSYYEQALREIIYKDLTTYSAWVEYQQRGGWNPYRDAKSGRFKNGPKKKGTKYAPSPRRNPHGVTVGPKLYGMLCGQLNTEHPGAQVGERFTLHKGNAYFDVEADGFGGLTIQKIHGR